MTNPKVIVVDTRNATEYERTQIVEIAEWKGKPPSTTAKWLGRAAAPLDKAVRAAFSEETIETALAEANKLAGKTLKEDLDAPLPSDLQAADGLAATSRKWAVGMAGASGAAQPTGIKTKQKPSSPCAFLRRLHLTRQLKKRRHSMPWKKTSRAKPRTTPLRVG